MDDTSADDTVVVAACQETQYSHDVNPEWDEWGRENTLFGYFFIEERLLFSSVEIAFNEAHDDVTSWVDSYNAAYGETDGYIYQEPIMFSTATPASSTHNPLFVYLRTEHCHISLLDTRVTLSYR